MADGVVKHVKKPVSEVRLTDLTGVYVKPEKEEMVFVLLAETISGTLTIDRNRPNRYIFAGDEPETCFTVPCRARRHAWLRHGKRLYFARSVIKSVNALCSRRFNCY